MVCFLIMWLSCLGALVVLVMNGKLRATCAGVKGCFSAEMHQRVT
jgi:hypothetical protein